MSLLSNSTATTKLNTKVNTKVNTNGIKESKKERGEGVISTAIAVLIVVALGGLMWAAYSTTFKSANKTVEDGVTAIGK